MPFYPEERFLRFLYEEVWNFVPDVIKNIMMTKDRLIRKKTAYQVLHPIYGLLIITVYLSILQAGKSGRFLIAHPCCEMC